MKAINPHASVEREVKEEQKEESGVSPKRKEAIGEDCPVYVTPSGPCFLSLFFLVFKKPRWSWRYADGNRCYEEMSEEDVKGGQLVWDESDEGCGKGQSQLQSQDDGVELMI